MTKSDSADFSEKYFDDSDVDFLDFRYQLHEALSDPALDVFDLPPGSGRSVIAGSDAARAAFRLAAVLGKCRLFAIEPGESLDGSLTIELAIAAAAESTRIAREDATIAIGLDEAYDEADADDEQEDIACAPLQSRMDLWASDTAIGECYAGAVISGDPRVAELGNAIDAFAEGLAELDTRLEGQIDILSIATETRLLDNWRSMLAPQFRNAPPWWLDGSLEAAVDNAARYCCRWLGGADIVHRAVAHRQVENGSRLGRTPGLKKMLEDAMAALADAFQRQFRPEAMLARAASSNKQDEIKILWDSEQNLAPLRCIVYRERNGDLRLDFSSTDDTHENQTFEVVVKEKTRPTVTFRRDPQTGELFGEARIPRDELPEADLSKLTFRLKKP